MELTLRLHATTTLIRIDMDKNTTIVRRKNIFRLTYLSRTAVFDSTNLATGSDLACENSARRTNHYRPSSRDRKNKNGYFESFGKSSKCTYKNCLSYLSKKIGVGKTSLIIIVRKYNDQTQRSNMKLLKFSISSEIRY